MPKNNDEMDLDTIYAGADPGDDEDLSGLDRGDSYETGGPEAPVEEPEEEEELPVEEPEGEEELPVEEPEAPVEAPEGEEEPSTEEPKARQPGDHKIPKSRFDEVNERRKAAERRAQELEQRLAQHDPAKAVNFDFDTKEKEYMDAVLDGDAEKAQSIRREIRAAEQAAFETLATTRADQAREATKAELEFDNTVAELNTKFPVFDPQAEGIYDADLVEEVLDLHAGFLGRGYTPAAALRKAVNYVAKANGIAEAGAEPEPAATRTLQDAPKPVKTDVKSKLDAAAKQPPKQAGRSTGEEKAVDVENMDEDEFDALPEATKRRLRGDA